MTFLNKRICISFWIMYVDISVHIASMWWSLCKRIQSQSAYDGILLLLGDVTEIHKRASLILNTAVECFQEHKAAHVYFEGDYLVL